MNNNPSNELPQCEVFILRLWFTRNRPSAWQAHVQQITSGKITLLHSFPELQAYLLQHIETPQQDKRKNSGLK